MVRIKSTMIAALSLVTLFAATAFTPAQFGDSKPGVDPELRRSLQELGYDYKVFDNGNVMVMVPTEDGHKVPVLISPPQTTPDGTSYRITMVLVKGYAGQGPANLTATLQQIGQGLPVGVLKTQQIDGNTVVFYLAPMPGAPSTSVLGMFLRGAVKSANQATRILNVA